MSTARRVCALTGCREVFFTDTRTENRKYCTPEHRKLARVERLVESAPLRTGRLSMVPAWTVRLLHLGPLQQRFQDYRLLLLHRHHRLDLFTPPRPRRPLAPQVRDAPPVELPDGAAGVGIRPRAAPDPPPVHVPAPTSAPTPAPAFAGGGGTATLVRPRPPPPRPALPALGRGPAVSPAELLRAAADSLMGNRLRSVLTMVGIVIGVSAVILLVSLGNGMRTDFNEDFGRLANQITITPAAKAGAGALGRDLNDQDVVALSDPRLAPYIASVSPSMSDAVTLTAGQTQARSNMVGVTHNYLDLLDRTIVAGRWFTPAEGSDKQRLVVVGPEALSLLGGPRTRPEQVIGATVRINQFNYEIIGVLESDGQNDNVVIVPFESSRSYLVGDIVGKVDQIVVKSTDVATLDLAVRDIIGILDANHKVREATERDYNVLTYTNLLNKSSQFITFMALFIVAIAAISLLVGGIGVANIMLVAVTERTREIGLRKAIGATNPAIMWQFLSEAVILTAIGGVVGIGLGIGTTIGSVRVLPTLVEDFPAPILTTEPVLVAFAVSLVIGVLAGVYPAYRASRMRPIDALRFD